MRDLQELADLIEEKKKERAVNFGSPKNAPPEEWIVNAEQVLGRLPYSYKYFLRNFRGGEVRKTEIFSLYENCLSPRPNVLISGELVRRARQYHEEMWLERHEISIMSNDFGETYYLKTDVFKDDECEVWVKRGEYKGFVSETFADFLYDKVKAAKGRPKSN